MKGGEAACVPAKQQEREDNGPPRTRTFTASSPLSQYPLRRVFRGTQRRQRASPKSHRLVSRGDLFNPRDDGGRLQCSGMWHTHGAVAFTAGVNNHFLLFSLLFHPSLQSNAGTFVCCVVASSMEDTM